MFWWLSFADGTLPRGSQFLGGVLIEAESFVDAIERSHALGINPGGEVKGAGPSWPADEVGMEAFEKYKNRLLTKEDAKEFDLKAKGHVSRTKPKHTHYKH